MHQKFKVQIVKEKQGTTTEDSLATVCGPFHFYEFILGSNQKK